MERDDRKGKAPAAITQLPRRFTPKPSKPRIEKKPKIEATDDYMDVEPSPELMKLLSKLQERGKREPKVAASPRFAFGSGDVPFMPVKKTEANEDKNGVLNSGHGSHEVNISMPLSGPVNESSLSSLNAEIASSQKTKKEYREPWDYKSNYPISLPLRPPYSGDPEELDKKEFEENLEYDENKVNCASELGLLEDDGKDKMILFQFPPSLSLGNILPRGSKGKGKEKADSSIPRTLGELPEGPIGKMLIYKSGKVKLKIGEQMFDVSPGAVSTCAQDVVAINTKSKDFCVLGNIDKKAIVTPDLDFLLNSRKNLS